MLKEKDYEVTWMMFPRHKLRKLLWMPGKFNMLKLLFEFSIFFIFHMINNLRSCSTAQEILNYLKLIYNQDNAVQNFQLELDIDNYNQSNFTVQEYYYYFLYILNLKTKYYAIINTDVPKASLVSI